MLRDWLLENPEPTIPPEIAADIDNDYEFKEDIGGNDNGDE